MTCFLRMIPVITADTSRSPLRATPTKLAPAITPSSLTYLEPVIATELSINRNIVRANIFRYSTIILGYITRSSQRVCNYVLFFEVYWCGDGVYLIHKLNFGRKRKGVAFTGLAW